MDDLRQGVSPAANRALDELELMDDATDPAKLIGQAMASVEAALATASNTSAASACTMAAARLIRAAELLEEQNAPPAGSPAAECPRAPDGRHQVDTSMESGPRNCFHCEAKM